MRLLPMPTPKALPFTNWVEHAAFFVGQVGAFVCLAIDGFLGRVALGHHAHDSSHPKRRDGGDVR